MFYTWLSICCHHTVGTLPINLMTNIGTWVMSFMFLPYSFLIMPGVHFEFLTVKHDHILFHPPCGHLKRDWDGQHCVLKAAASGVSDNVQWLKTVLWWC